MSEYRKVFRNGNSNVVVVPSKICKPLMVRKNTMLKMDVVNESQFLVTVQHDAVVNLDSNHIEGNEQNG